MEKAFTLGLVMAGMLTSGIALAADKTDDAIEYRQSQMTLVGANFKPMMGMVKGEVDFNADMLKAMASDLDAVAGLNWKRGYIEGSDEGETKAEKSIWKNMDDFSAKYDDFQAAAGKLNELAAAGDKDAMMAQVKELGGTCKACHKEYKSK